MDTLGFMIVVATEKDGEIVYESFKARANTDDLEKLIDKESTNDVSIVSNVKGTPVSAEEFTEMLSTKPPKRNKKVDVPTEQWQKAVEKQFFHLDTLVDVVNELVDKVEESHNRIEELEGIVDEITDDLTSVEFHTSIDGETRWYHFFYDWLGKKKSGLYKGDKR